MRIKRFFSDFLKDITRFFPVWGLFLLVLVLTLLSFPQSGAQFYNFTQQYQQMHLFFAPYGFLCAAVLHRQEKDSFAHTLAGLLFFAVPFALFQLGMGLLISPLLPEAVDWLINAYWVGICVYLFFYGAGIFAMKLAKKRFLLGAVFFLLLNLLVIGIFELVGFVASFSENDWVHYDWQIILTQGLTAIGYTGLTFVKVQWRLWCFAGIGVILAALAPLLYRKSKLPKPSKLLSVTVLLQDCRRFSPVWGLFLLLAGVLLLLIHSSHERFYQLITVGYRYMGWVIAPYALLCATTLFGDLFQKKLCYTLHSMPLGRTKWFLTHTVAGLLFFAVPFLLFQAGAYGSYLYFVFWFSTLYGFLEFILFFGIALLCCMCAGNRVGAGLLFLLLNFLAPVLQWIGTTLYQPLLYGVPLNIDWFAPLSPLMYLPTHLAYYADAAVAAVATLHEAILMGYFWTCAGVGILATVAALLLYRKRKLESAGDPISIPWLRPVFVAAFSLLVAVGLFRLPGHGANMTFLLIPYMFLGYFGSKMILSKSFRVFQGNAVLGFGILVFLLFGSLGLCYLDPAGTVHHAPAPSRVEAVQVTVDTKAKGNLDSSFFASGNRITDEQQIQRLMELQNRLIEEEGAYEEREDMLYITYHTKSGIKIQRYYPVNLAEEESLCQVLSSFEALFGMDYEELKDSYLRITGQGKYEKIGTKYELIYIAEVVLGDTNISQEGVVRVENPTLEEAFLRYLQKDSEKGYLAQYPEAHPYASKTSGTLILETKDGTQHKISLYRGYIFRMIQRMYDVGVDMDYRIPDMEVDILKFAY